MRKWYNEHYKIKESPVLLDILHGSFRCASCKQAHGILGSRQKKSKVTGKLVRYCKQCFENKYGE